MNKIKAFTLAEVLITLTILGVVAAITVPSLQKMNYKRTQISRMAKAYATLESAATNIAEKSGCIGKDLECTGLLNLSGAALRNRFIELSGFRVNTKYVGSTYFYTKPVSHMYAPTGTFGKLMQAFVTTPDNLAYSIKVNDVIRFNSGKIGGYSIGASKGIQVTVVTDKNVLYDENGKVYTRGVAKDAISGYNVFQFVIYDNFKVDPLCTVFGGQQWPMSRVNTTMYFRKNDVNTYCDPKTPRVDGNTDYSDSCTCRIVKDGWKMKY